MGVLPKPFAPNAAPQAFGSFKISLSDLKPDNILWQQQSSSREPIVGSASFASQYLAEGWRVFAACHNPDAAKLRCLAKDMLNVVAMDVTDAESVRNATTQLKDVAIDVLINSAGIAGASGQKTGNVDYESWAHVFNVNTMGPLRVVESFSDHIARSERNLAITITSGMGVRSRFVLELSLARSPA